MALVDTFQDLINRAAKNHETYNKGREAKRWKYCVALYEKGYVCTECNKIPESEDLHFIWKKNREDEAEIKVRLSFVEQQLWLDYLERKFQKGEKDDSGHRKGEDGSQNK